MLSRKPLPLLTLQINDAGAPLRDLEGLLNARYENLALVGYESHGKIAATVAV